MFQDLPVAVFRGSKLETTKWIIISRKFSNLESSEDDVVRVKQDDAIASPLTKDLLLDVLWAKGHLIKEEVNFGHMWYVQRMLLTLEMVL